MIDHVLQAMAEPHRRDILVLVQHTELSASEIAAHFTDISRQAVSQHLALLIEAGLLTMHRRGTQRLYRARPEGLEELRRFLDGFWDEQLHLLKQAAETLEGRSDPDGVPPTQ